MRSEGWRRDPIGAGLRALEQRMRGSLPASTHGLLLLSDEEFVAALRESGASERMIEKELRMFQQLKAGRAAVEEGRRRHTQEEIERVWENESLTPYAEAEARRQRVKQQESGR